MLSMWYACSTAGQQFWSPSCIFLIHPSCHRAETLASYASPSYGFILGMCPVVDVSSLCKVHSRTPPAVWAAKPAERSAAQGEGLRTLRHADGRSNSSIVQTPRPYSHTRAATDSVRSALPIAPHSAALRSPFAVRHSTGRRQQQRQAPCTSRRTHRGDRNNSSTTVTRRRHDHPSRPHRANHRRSRIRSRRSSVRRPSPLRNRHSGHSSRSKASYHRRMRDSCNSSTNSRSSRRHGRDRVLLRQGVPEPPQWWPTAGATALALGG
jgi:hypothetical protein